MTRTQFINELKAVLNTEDIIYMHHNKATIKKAQIVEVAVDGQPLVFTVDTTEWINNAGVKFTYNDIIKKLKERNLNVVKYAEQKKKVANILSGKEEVKTTFKNGEKVTLKTGYTFTWNESTYIEDLKAGDKITISTGYTFTWGETSFVSDGGVFGYSKALDRVALLCWEKDLETATIKYAKRKFGNIKQELSGWYSTFPDSMELSAYRLHILRRIKLYEFRNTSLSKEVMKVLKSDLEIVNKYLGE